MGLSEVTSTDAYRLATDGEGDPELVYAWTDKPRRLVLDLCARVDALDAQVAQQQEALDRVLAWADKLESNKDKFGMGWVSFVADDLRQVLQEN